MRISHRYRNGTVAEQLLDDSDRHPSRCEMRREGVAKQMPVRRPNACAFAYRLKQLRRGAFRDGLFIAHLEDEVIR